MWPWQKGSLLHSSLLYGTRIPVADDDNDDDGINDILIGSNAFNMKEWLGDFPPTRMTQNMKH